MRPEQRDAQHETLARMIRHPLRQRVLSKYSEAVTSPSAVAAALGARLNIVSYHTQVLLRAGVVELVRTERRRGASQHFYRARSAGPIEDAEWERLPTNLRRALVRHAIDEIAREAADALPRSGMDDGTAHVSRSYLVLDRQGRDELSSLLRATFASARDMGQASRERGNDDAVPCEVVLMSFQRASRP
jgi:DNA-binding transcriptional ArsR family regulator